MRPPDLTSVALDSIPDAAIPLPEGDFWVFGYGSLMWRPDFPYRERRAARLFGHHRRLCVWSARHRGTPSSPGLVLGLDSGGSCVGRAFRVAEKEKRPVAEYLQQRELVTNVYLPRIKTIQFANSRQVQALVFIVRRDHPQYSGRLEPTQAAHIIADAHGASGANRDYILNTVDHLEQIGIHDAYLHQVRTMLNSTDLSARHAKKE